MKNDFVIGSHAAASARNQLDTTVGFLLARRQGTDLTPTGRREGSAYVWRRVFLNGKARRG
jgi:hypothetical protein